MNKSKRVFWELVKSLYAEGLTPIEIITNIKDRQYFDESIIPSGQVIADWLYRQGLSTERLREKRQEAELRKELNKLKQKLQKKKYQKEVDALTKALKDEDESIDDLAYAKIAEMKVLIQILVNDARKKENGQIDSEKILKAAIILDKLTNTLLKARVLKGKATSRIDIEEKETIHDIMRKKHLPKNVLDDIEKTMKDSGTVENE